MLDELEIYNLAIKYPNTVDLVREVEKIARADAFDELLDLIDRLLWNYDKETYKDLSEYFKESARLLKEQKNEEKNI